MLDVGDGIAGQPDGVEDFRNREAEDDGLHRNDQAKSGRVVVDAASPAAAGGRTRDDIPPDAPDRGETKIPNTVAMKAGSISKARFCFRMAAGAE